jgi:hypothetical protein
MPGVCSGTGIGPGETALYANSDQENPAAGSNRSGGALHRGSHLRAGGCLSRSIYGQHHGAGPRAPVAHFTVIDQLRPGETVDIGGCRQGWCYITTDGGFVSSSYLRNNGAVVSPNFNLNFNFPQGSFSIGTSGVQIGIGTPPPPPVRPGPGRPGHDGPRGTDGPGAHGDRQVCFFSDPGYDGQSLCLDRGDQMASLPRGWNNRISSFTNRRGYAVTICRERGFDRCRTYTTSASSLGRYDNNISSIRVR